MNRQITILGLLAVLGLAAVITALLLGLGTRELASEGLNAGWETGQLSPLNGENDSNNSSLFSDVEGVQPPNMPQT